MPCPLPLKFSNSSGYVGDLGSLADVFISDVQLNTSILLGATAYLASTTRLVLGNTIPLGTTVCQTLSAFQDTEKNLKIDPNGCYYLAMSSSTTINVLYF